MKKVKFNATVTLGRGLDPIKVPFELETETNEMAFSWDDVFDGGCDAARKIYSEDDFPNMEVGDLEIVMDDGVFPVLAEDYDKDMEKLGVKKALVLGYARYTLTPEYKLFLSMKERGILSEDDEFDADEMRELVDIARGP
jgi:hypothetical protein